MTPEQVLADWLHRARLAAWLNARGEPWPAWSTGEFLAVALILDDAEELRALDYTHDEALERLRYDLGEGRLIPTPITKEAAGAAIARLREQLRAEVTPGGADHD